MRNCNTSISRIFTKKVFTDLLNKGENEIYDYIVQSYIDDCESKTNREIISNIYSRMGESYRNEYFYMNTLLNKLLFGIHNVNTTTALSQVRVSNHIADFVMINGDGHVYEIKSELDNLERLNTQLTDYFKAFSLVSVLSPERERNHVESQLKKLGKMGNAVGIYVLTDRNTIFNRDNYKLPKRFNEKLDSYCLFTLLRKKEYQNIIQEYYGYLPKVAPAFYFKKCYSMFQCIPILEAQKKVMEELKKRNQIKKEFYESVPLELRSLVYFYQISKDTQTLNCFLNQKYGG